MASAPADICWHRDLPPLDAVAVAEHTVEADSARVTASSWDRHLTWTCASKEPSKYAAGELWTR